MSDKRDTFKLGVTVIVMFALFLGALLFIGGGGFFVKERARLVVRFSPGSTLPELSKGATVTYLGQQVGVVEHTGIVEAPDPGHPEVADQQFLEVHAGLSLDLDLRTDCSIVASGPPLGGQGSLSILSRGVSETRLDSGQAVYGQTAGFQAALEMIARELDDTNPAGLIARIKSELQRENARSLVARIHDSLGDINHITTRLAAELDRQSEEVLMAKLHQAVDQLNGGLTELTGLVADSRPKINSTLSSVEQAADTANTGVVGVLARELELEADREVSLLAKVHDAFDSLNQSLADFTVVSGETKKIVVLNRSRISELIENAAAASLHLKQGIKDLSLHPWKVIFEPSERERRELYIMNVARDFSEAAAHLDDSTSRLKSLLDANPGGIAQDDPTLKQVRAQLIATVEKYTAAEQALWAALNVR